MITLRLAGRRRPGEPLVAAGEPIAVVAPCSIHDPARLERGLDIARAHGHRFELAPDLLRPWRYLASDDDQRAGQLQAALADEVHGAVWMARGGYGLTRILDRLVFDRVQPKLVLGFSDITALFAALYRRSPAMLVHAPVLHSLPITDPASVAHTFALLAGEVPEPYVGEVWVEGEAEGPLVGGNLCVLTALCGTRWQLDVRGHVVVLEDVGEPPYRIDRMLQQLIDAGGLEGATGIAFGEFDGCNPPDGASFTLKDVLLEKVGRLGLPVIGGLPFGHGARNRPFAWGQPARMVGGALIVAG